MTSNSAYRHPAMSVAEANRIVLENPRFALDEHDVDGRVSRNWRLGPKTIIDIVELYRSHGDSDFIVYQNERCTYAGAVRASETIAAKLIQAGLQAGDRVALLMRNRTEWPVCFIGALLAGAVIVPINGWALPGQLRSLLEDCQARFLFSDRNDVEVPVSVERVWTVDTLDASDLRALIGEPEAWQFLPDTSCALPTPSPLDLAALFYTSGTTSKPKAAMITQRALTATITNTEFNAERVKLRYPAPTDAKPPFSGQIAALFPVPLFHVTGAIPGLIGTSVLGAKIVLMRRWDIGEALRLIEREQINLMGGVPTMPLQLLADPRSGDHDLSSLVAFLYGGAPAPIRLPTEIADRFGAEASTGWGMTETASTLLHNTGPEYSRRPASCGIVVPVNEVRIADTQSISLPPGRSGELQVRGMTITQGYWSRPVENSSAFTSDGWFRTGDIATMDDDGFVTIVDRAKDIIIRGGENIACIEIEDVLSNHPRVVEAAVIGRAHISLGEEPVAFVTVLAGTTATGDDIRHFAAERLSKYKIPVEVIIERDALPKNAAGKVEKQVLRKRFQASESEANAHD